MEDRGVDPEHEEKDTKARTVQVDIPPKLNQLQDHGGPALPDDDSSGSVKLRQNFETMNGSYHFTITGYSHAKGLGSGKYIASGSFAVAGHDWAIYFYPDGKSEEDHELYVSVFIALVGDSSDVQAIFELTLLDRSGKGKHKTHSHFEPPFLSSPYTLKYKGRMWGYKRFFRRGVLEQSDFLIDDTLELTGKVGVLVSSTKTTKLSTTPPSSLSPFDIHQRSDDDSSYFSLEGLQSVNSPSDTGAANKARGLRIQDELARYYHKLDINRATQSAAMR